MSPPTSPTDPAQPTDPEQQPDPEPLADAEFDDAEPAEAPLNRAARRANPRRTEPSHVGPRDGPVRSGRGPRSHTKRRSR